MAGEQTAAIGDGASASGEQAKALQGHRLHSRYRVKHFFYRNLMDGMSAEERSAIDQLCEFYGDIGVEIFDHFADAVPADAEDGTVRLTAAFVESAKECSKLLGAMHQLRINRLEKRVQELEEMITRPSK
ncbi:hypothetical protein ACVIHI_002666 [Bradyrhizobium sp. USDA 4524]|uniref:hypothetical protein n=1 Tax=unclassified Bradyrhizobium TaxID=2631580 RepID=UPI00209F2C89|nr:MULTISPECIES: hypothetical protein [unclassified Bradyrhizobium]MCP1844413.1 hypothetical protein [Bradyrhizobium sp. USDA 4538]MCP1904979.1 hypothetical protein [Bradyrhizobium sp. USDA 4537]MCP1989365.1 hypothetical protein [Bradyrhizobium sp. USDA 4539]